MIQFIRRAIVFLLLVLMQVLILNHVHIGGYATPSLFIYYILILNSETSRTSLLSQAFFMGLLVDIFGNTPGMNAASATLMAFARPTLLRMQMTRDISEDYEPGIRILGFFPFFRYVLNETFVFVIILQLLNSFSFFRMEDFVIKVLTDVGMTVLCIMCVDILRRKK